MMEMTLVLAHLYRRFDVKLAKPDEELQLSAQFITRPSKFIKEYFVYCHD